jgi:hypothetical protein
MGAETFRKGVRERSHELRAKEQKLEVEPDLAVVARLEDEVAFPLRKELRDLLLHVLDLRRSSSAPGRRDYDQERLILPMREWMSNARIVQ